LITELLVIVSDPETLHPLNVIPTGNNQAFFAGTRQYQKVTDDQNQYYKKPHWKHVTSFYTL
jgi:hypothetical protein